MAADQKPASIGQRIFQVAVKQEEEWLPEDLHAPEVEFQQFFIAPEPSISIKTEIERAHSDDEILATYPHGTSDADEFTKTELILDEEFLSDSNESDFSPGPRESNQRLISHGGSETSKDFTETELTLDKEFSYRNHDSNSASCSQPNNQRVFETAKNQQVSPMKPTGTMETCKLCSNVLPKDCMGAHMTEVHYGKRLQCEFCPRSFMAKATLTRHNITCKGAYITETSCEELYRCKICQRKFKESRSLKRHMHTHEENRPRNYACGQCEAKFLDKSALERHLNIHTKEKKYPCHLCDKIFYSSSSLMVHVRRHIGEIYNCKRCGACFPNKLRWEKHTRCCKKVAKPNKKRYKCTLCCKDYATEYKLKLHYKFHDGLPWKCIICARTFLEKVGVRRHLTNVHKMADKTEEELNKFVCEATTVEESSIEIQPKISTTIEVEYAYTVTEALVQRSPRGPKTASDFEKAENELTLKEEFLDDKNDSDSISNSPRTYPHDLQTADDQEAEENRPRNYACGQCESTFVDMCALERHLSTHSNKERKFNCERCGSRFMQKTALERHELSCKKDGTSVKARYKRRHCDKEYVSEAEGCHSDDELLATETHRPNDAHAFIKTELTLHEESLPISNDSDFSCVPRKSKQRLLSQGRIELGKDIHTQESFETSDEQLTLNEEFSDSKNNSKSASCSQSNNQSVLEVAKNQQVGPVKPTSNRECCKLCPKVVPKDCMEAHMTVVHHGKRLQCEFCPRSFMSKGFLTRHNIICKGAHITEASCEELYRCEICQQIFVTKSGLRKHRHIHEESRPCKYACGQCEAKFLDKTGLERHLNIHTKKRKYPCHLCDQIFYTSSGLHLHVKRHIGETDNCGRCGARFPDKLKLERHERCCKNVATPKKKRYKCTLCCKGYASEYKLKLHYKCHNGLPWKCSICGRGFVGRERVRCHLTNVHKLTDKTQEELNTFVCMAATAEEASIEVEPIKSTTEVELCYTVAETLVQRSPRDPQTSNEEPEHELMLKEEFWDAKNDLDSISSFRRTNYHHLETSDEQQAEENRLQNYACGQCESTFVEMRALDRHLTTHSTKYNSVSCGACFPEKAALKSHKLSCNKDGTSEKDWSDRMFDKKYASEAEGCHSNDELLATGPHRANDAREFTKTELALDEESLAVRNDSESSPCPEKSNESLTSHRGSELGHGNFTKESFETSKDYTETELIFDGMFSVNKNDSNSASCSQQNNQRVLEAAQNQPVGPIKPKSNMETCQLCPNVVPKDCMEAHMNEVHGGKGHQCDFCSRSFVSKRFLKRHNIICKVARATEGSCAELYRCEICKRKFKQEKALKRHKYIHEEKSPRIYNCGQCEAKFRFRSYFERHLNTHTKEKKYPCNLCDKILYSLGGLQLHVRRHTGESYNCERCRARFPDKFHLERHVPSCKNAPDKKRYKCSLCRKDYASQFELKQHYKYHTGLPWKCSICAKGFLFRSKVRRHLTNVHKKADKTQDELNKFVCAVATGNNPPTEVEPIKSTAIEVEHSQSEEEAYGTQLSTTEASTPSETEVPQKEEVEVFATQLSRPESPAPNTAQLPQNEEFLDDKNAFHPKTHQLTRNPQTRIDDLEAADFELKLEEEFLGSQT